MYSIQTRGVDQCVEWFVKWFSVHRAFDRIVKQLSINNVLHKSAIEYAIEPREYPLGTVVVVHRGTMNTRDDTVSEKFLCTIQPRLHKDLRQTV